MRLDSPARMFDSPAFQAGKRIHGATIVMKGYLLLPTRRAHITVRDMDVGTLPSALRLRSLIIDANPISIEGDIIGCGVDFTQNRGFYTKNGKFLGPYSEYLLYSTTNIITTSSHRSSIREPRQRPGNIPHHRASILGRVHQSEFRA
jgi:hypothetical protein